MDIARAAEAQSDPMTACYIDDSFYAMLIFAYKYGHDPESCLLKSVNAGGENVNRSAVLGFLLGLAHGEKAWPKRLRDGLVQSVSYEEEIAQFSDRFCPDISGSEL